MPPEAPSFVPEEEKLIVDPAHADFSAHGRREQRENMEEKLERNSKIDHDFRQMLNLFGTSQARSHFVELCRKYVENHSPNSSSGEEEYRSSAAKLSRTTKLQRGQADYHNEIMETLRKLISTQPSHSENWKLLDKFQDRKLVEDVLVRGDWRQTKNEE